mgnify:CR=1 FL=1|jgi:hypothetical protein|tara:strand:+ start:55 stop:579 length:525 start_codon:yes stop_codon:yes gene_type:complete
MEIDLKFITEQDLSPDEYTYLYIVYRDAYPLLEKVKLSDIRQGLIDDGWLVEGDLDLVSSKFERLFISDFDSMFAELIATYPNRVKTSSGSVRVLCAKDPEAHSNKKARSRYMRVVKNKPKLHSHIIECLNNQLKVTEIEYMQNIETWLNNYTWERYTDIDEKDGNERRITRKL